MIGSIEVKVTAHSPQKPITPFFTFKDSPSSLRIIDVPKSIGDWKITEVRVAIEYPDGVTVARGATRNGNVWVATIEGTSTTGKVVKGCQILANGIDEQGQEVTGYVLGIGDVFVLERDSTISPSDDDEYYTVKYCEETPTNPQKGNLIIEDEIVKIWDGEEWFIVGGGDDKRDYADLTFAPLTMNNDPAHYGIESFDLYANGSLFTLSHFNIGNHTWYNENAGYSIVGLSKDYFAVYSSGVYQPIATFSRTSDSQTSWEFIYSGMTMTVSATPMTSTTIALANAVPWRTTELNNDAGFITANSQVFQQIQQDISALASSMSSKRDYSDITWKYTMANDDVMYGIQKFYVTRNASGQEDQSYDMTSFTPSNHTWIDATVENSLKVRASARNSFSLLSSDDTEIGTFYRSSDTNTQWLITRDEDGVQAEYTIIAWKRADDKFAMNSELSKVITISGTFFTSSILSNSSFSFDVVVK